MMHKILSATVAGEYVVKMRFSDGLSGNYDMRPLVDAGGVFSALRDPSVFERVQIGEGGRYIEWPSEIDLCADALWRAVQGMVDAA